MKESDLLNIKVVLKADFPYYGGDTRHLYYKFDRESLKSATPLYKRIFFSNSWKEINVFNGYWEKKAPDNPDNWSPTYIYSRYEFEDFKKTLKTYSDILKYKEKVLDSRFPNYKRDRDKYLEEHSAVFY